MRPGVNAPGRESGNAVVPQIVERFGRAIVHAVHGI
jgi:hypothetical protein